MPSPHSYTPLKINWNAFYAAHSQHNKKEFYYRRKSWLQQWKRQRILPLDRGLNVWLCYVVLRSTDAACEYDGEFIMYVPWAFKNTYNTSINSRLDHYDVQRDTHLEYKKCKTYCYYRTVFDSWIVLSYHSVRTHAHVKYIYSE